MIKQRLIYYVSCDLLAAARSRNSEFAAALRQLLATPWRFAGEICEKDTLYIRDHSCSDREILYGLD